MSGVITGRAARVALDYITGKSLDLGAAPQAMTLALLTQAPPTNPWTQQLNEVSSTGYARQSVTWSPAVTPSGQPSQIANSGNVLFGPFTGVNGLSFPATHCALIGTGLPSFVGNLLTANEVSVETDISAWNAVSNCTIARSTAQAKDGIASIAATIAAAGDATILLNNSKPVGIDTVYRASAWMYSPVAGLKAAMDYLWYDASGNQFTSSLGTKITLVANTWTEVFRLVTIRQVLIAAGRPQMRIEGTAPGQIVYVDNMAFNAQTTEDILMTWAFDQPGQAAQSESLQISAGNLTMSLG